MLYTVSMVSEIEVKGKKYITSKAAAGETGYAQDYIGQLARAGNIEAERSGGLWYVDLDSVRAHKANAAENILKSPVTVTAPPKVESIVSFDGKDYVSSKRGAKITGYSQDYVTQLARSGKILSRQISNRWYVSKSELVAHKEHNDALLASVQSEAVGLKRERKEARPSFEDPVPTLNYFSDGQDLMPLFPEKVKKYTEEEIGSKENGSNQIHNIPIKVGNLGRNSIDGVQSQEGKKISMSQHVLDLDEILDEKTPEKSEKGMKFALAGAALTTLLVVAIGVGMFLPSNSKFTRSGDSNTPISVKTVRQSASAIAATIQNYAQNILGGGLQYRR